MPDSRHDLKPRKIRFKITGGTWDIQHAEELLKEEYLAAGWDVNFYELKPRGDYGPLHDLSLGFIQSIN
jgi:hypothetical protein